VGLINLLVAHVIFDLCSPRRFTTALLLSAFFKVLRAVFLALNILRWPFSNLRGIVSCFFMFPIELHPSGESW